MTMSAVDSLGGAEQFITVALPNYGRERLLLSLGLGAAVIFWIIVVPFIAAARHNEQNQLSRTQRTTTIKSKTITIVRSAKKSSSSGKPKISKTAKSNGGGSSIAKKEASSNSSTGAAESAAPVENGIVMPVISLLGCLITCCYLIVTKSSNNSFAARGIFEAPLLRPDECQAILERSYAAAARNIVQLEQAKSDGNNEKNATQPSLLLEEPLGWQKLRHSAYPTIDLNLVTDPFTADDRAYIQTLMDARLAPLLQRVYGLSSAQSIRANDMFVVRYTADTRASLARHTDDADISFNILLSDEFQGGGTRFWNRLTESDFTTVKPTRVGQVLLHSSLVQHEGLPVSDGTRHILVGFLAVDSMEPMSAQPTDLSWFASYFSLPFLHVKLKEGYAAAHIRNQKRAIGDSEKQRWTDHKYARSFFRDFILLVEYVGDIVCPHRHYPLVIPTPENDNAVNDFIQQLDESAFNNGNIKSKKKASWFSGQQLNLDFDGSVASEWMTRRQSQEEFREL